MASDGRGLVDGKELVAQVVKSVKNIFSTMVFMEDIEQMENEEGAVSSFSSSISGLVGLGGSCSGVVGLHLPETFATEAAASMLGMEVAEMTEECDVHDAIGELANMLAGEVKLLLTEKGINAFLSTPSIISGKEYSIDGIAESKTEVVVFQRNGCKFIATVQVDKE